jgi:hypothetical protein
MQEQQVMFTVMGLPLIKMEVIMQILLNLNESCSDYAVASSLRLFYDVFKMVSIIVPIILIISVIVSLVKLMINPDDKKGLPGIYRKVIAAFLIFLLPNSITTVVNLYNSGSNDTNTVFNVLTCFQSSKKTAESITAAIYKEGAGTEKGSGLTGMFGDLSGLSQYTGSSSVAGEGAQKLINIAIGEIGNNEADKTHEKYAISMGNPTDWAWCAMFVTWCSKQAGFIDSGIMPEYQHCSVGISFYQGKNEFHLASSGYTPKPGDIAFYGDGGNDHTGIVEKVDANYIYTIEGNTTCEGETASLCKGTHGVSRKTRPRVGWVYGYGSPAY